MPSWVEFRRAFKMPALDTRIDKVTVNIQVYSETCANYEAMIASQILDPDVQRRLEEDLENQRKILKNLEHTLNGLELEKSIKAREAFDEQTLEELTGPGGGLELTLAKQTQARAVTAEAQEAVGDASEALNGAQDALNAHLGKYPELAGLLAAVTDNTALLTTRDEALGPANQKVDAAAEALAKADTALIAMTGDDGDPSQAATLVAAFTRTNGALATARTEYRAAVDAQRAAKASLQTSQEALEAGIVKVLQTTVTKPSKDDKALFTLYIALKGAKLALSRAQDVHAKAEKAEGVTDIDVERMNSRALLLRKKKEVTQAAKRLRAKIVSPPLNGIQPWVGSVKEIVALLDVSPQGRVQLAETITASREVMFGLEELIKLGLTPDEVKDFYALLDWPEMWLPPSLRAQEKNWVDVQDLITTESIEENQKKQATKLETLGLGVLDFQDSVIPNLAEALNITGVTEDNFSKKLDKWLTLFSSVVTLAKAGVDAGSAPTSEDADPVEQMMEIDDALNNIASVGSSFIGTATSALDLSTATVIAELIPVIDGIKAFGEMCKNSIQAVNRWRAAMADAEVHRKALAEKHRAEGATDKVQSRGKHVAARKTSDAAADVVEFAAFICTLSGVGAPVAAGVKAGASVIRAVKKVSVFAIDATHAEAAKLLLNEARAGNPVAREEIFRFHGRYACALIAILAEEGDPIALSIYHNHDVTEDMVIKSSAKVLKKYLMRELEEVDDPTSWSDIKKYFVETGDAISSFFITAWTATKDLAEIIHPYVTATLTVRTIAEQELAIIKHSMTTKDYVARGLSDLADARKQLVVAKDRLANMPDTHTDYATAQGALTEWNKKTQAFETAMEECRKKVVDNLKDAAILITIMARLTDELGSHEVASKKIGEGSKRRFQELVDEQRRCLTLIAQAS